MSGKAAGAGAGPPDPAAAQARQPWCKLVESRLDAIWRGELLRMPAEYPYESVVDLLVIRYEDKLALLVASGYKAGLIRQVLPASAYLDGNTCALSRTWLVEHWSDWVDIGAVSNVWIRADNPAPGALPVADPSQ